MIDLRRSLIGVAVLAFVVTACGDQAPSSEAPAGSPGGERRGERGADREHPGRLRGPAGCR